MAASSAHTDGCTASLFNTLSILPSLSFLAKLRKSTVQISCREMHIRMPMPECTDQCYSYSIYLYGTLTLSILTIAQRHIIASYPIELSNSNLVTYDILCFTKQTVHVSIHIPNTLASTTRL